MNIEVVRAMISDPVRSSVTGRGARGTPLAPLLMWGLHQNGFAQAATANHKLTNMHGDVAAAEQQH